MQVQHEISESTTEHLLELKLFSAEFCCPLSDNFVVVEVYQYWGSVLAGLLLIGGLIHRIKYYVKRLFSPLIWHFQFCVRQLRNLQKSCFLKIFPWTLRMLFRHPRRKFSAQSPKTFRLESQKIYKFIIFFQFFPNMFFWTHAMQF